MSSVWPAQAVWLRLAAPVMVMAAMPLAAALTPGFVLWRHGMAGPMLTSGMIRRGAPAAQPRTTPRLRAVSQSDGPRKTSQTAPGQGGRMAKVTLAAVPDPRRKA